MEKQAWKINGFLAILISLLMLAAAVWLFINLKIVLGIVLVLISLFISSGIVVVQPNQAKVLTFFGSYVGSIREQGIWMTVPLVLRKKVSLRVRNFNSKTLKVNDVEGNPIEIAAVVV